MRLEPLLAEMLKALVALDSFSALSAVQESVAPLAVKVRPTGPGATRGAELKGMAEEAPGVVSTVVGSTKLLEALAPLVCVGEASAIVVKTLAPLELASSIFSALAEPLYCTGATVVPRRKACKADAVPLSTRLDEPEPLIKETSLPPVAEKLPEAALSVRVSPSSAAVLASSSAALVKSRVEGCPAVMARAAGSALITGDVACPLLPTATTTGATASISTVLTVAAIN